MIVLLRAQHSQEQGGNCKTENKLSVQTEKKVAGFQSIHSHKTFRLNYAQH